MRIEVEFQNATCDAVIHEYMNPPADDGLIQDQKCLEKRADGSEVKYWRMKIPMMSDRDVVSQQWVVEKEGGKFLMLKSVEHKDAPLVKGVVRMQFNAVALLHQVGDNVKQLEFEHYDMKGYMPASLLNMVVAGESIEFLTKLKKRVDAKK